MVMLFVEKVLSWDLLVGKLYIFFSQDIEKLGFFLSEDMRFITND